MSISDYINSIIICGAIFSFVLAMFWKADDAFSDEIKKDLSYFLVNSNFSTIGNNWVAIYLSMFNKLFGDNHFSVRCFFRSASATLLTTIIFSVLFMSKSNDLFQGIFTSEYESKLFLTIIGVVIIINIIPDYVSLLETRLLLRLYKEKFRNRAKSRSLLLSFVFFDLLATVFIALSVALFVEYIGTKYLWSAPSFFEDQNLNEEISSGEIPSDDFKYLYILFAFSLSNSSITLLMSSLARNISFFSTFAGSIWMMLFLFGQSFFNFLSKSKFIVKAVRYALPIETFPFRSIGVVSAVSFSFLYFIFITALYVIKTFLSS